MNKSRLFSVLLLLLFTVGCVSNGAQTQPPSADMSFKITTWNVEHLAFPYDTGCRPRTADEITALSAYAQSLDADVVALQEVASVTAVRQIFPESQWQIIMSQRADSEAYECRGSGRMSTQQKVAFAVKNTVPVLAVEHLNELSLTMPGLRYGLVIQVDSPNGAMDILNVHMKSGCFVDDYQSSDSESCQVYARQIPVLDNWIEQRERQGTAYVVLGDFNHRLSAYYNRASRLLFTEDRSASLVTRKVIGCHPRYPAPIDHILVGGLDARAATASVKVHEFENMQEAEMLSDHCAISATLFANPN